MRSIIAKNIPPPTQASDADLLRQIALRRCKQSFSELYDRYQGPAYALAMHILGHTHRAEEAIQEAMLRVWRGAGRFRNGDAKSWILQIVANECRRGLQKRRPCASAVLSPGSEPCAPAESPCLGALGGEERAMLGECLKEIPATDRYLLTLYYGADLNQREIGRLLCLSQSSISERIRETLAVLRRGLAQRGLAAAAPLLAGPRLGREMVRIGQTPPHLKQQIWASITSTAQARAGRAPLLAKSGGAGLLLAAAAYVAAGVPILRSPESNPAQPPGAPVGLQQLNGRAPTPNPNDRRVWDFEAGPPQDLMNVSGAWHWVQRKPTASHCLLAQDRSPATLLLPIGKARGPFMLRLKVLSEGPGLAWIHPAWADSSAGAPFRQIRTDSCPNSFPFNGAGGPNAQKTLTKSLYFVGKFCAIYDFENQLLELQAYQSPNPGDRIALVGMNLLLEELEYCPLSPRELPEECAGLDQIMSASLRLGTRATFYPSWKYSFPPSLIR